jgi:hypothetical protein
MDRLVHEEDGIVFVSTAIVVSVILGLVVMYLNNSMTLNITEAMEVYSAKQSYWTAISGIEYALEKAEDELDDVPGNYQFFNSLVSLFVFETDQNGAPLSGNQVRVVSVGQHAQGKRILEVRLEIAGQDFWPALSIIQEVNHNEFDIKEQFTLNDSLYIGGDVDVDEDVAIGDPPGQRTHLYVPSGHTVSGEFDANFSWSQYPDGTLNLPVISSVKYDSLINIAEAITTTSGNRYKGNLTINGGTFDLSNYDHNTYFIKGKLTVKGAVITGGTITNPGFIVTTDRVEIKRLGVTQSLVHDNIIIVTKKKVELKDETQYGIDYSSLSPTLRPYTTNEIYARDEIKIRSEAEAWAQLISLDQIIIEGRVYGVVHSIQGLEFDQDNSFLEGALYVRKITEPDDELDKGKMDLNHAVPLYHHAGIRYQVIPSSLKEI